MPSLLNTIRNQTDLDILIATGDLPLASDKWFREVQDNLDSFKAADLGKIFSIVSHAKSDAVTESYGTKVEMARVNLLEEISRLYVDYQRLTVKDLRDLNLFPILK
jgi:hypothetical protein